MPEQILTIDLDGTSEVSRRLGQYINRLEHPAPLLDAVGAELQANIDLRFETKTDPDGKPWAPLSALTPQFYALFGHGQPGAAKPSKERWAAFREGQLSAEMPGSLLERTRHMRQSLSHNATDAFVDVGFSRATDGGTYQVAMLHEFGTKSMPRRGLMTADPKTGRLGEEDTQDVLAEITAYLSGI